MRKQENHIKPICYFHDCCVSSQIRGMISGKNWENSRMSLGSNSWCGGDFHPSSVKIPESQQFVYLSWFNPIWCDFSLRSHQFWVSWLSMTMGRFFRASLAPVGQDCDAYVKDIAAALQAGGFGHGGKAFSCFSLVMGWADVSRYQPIRRLPLKHTRALENLNCGRYVSCRIIYYCDLFIYCDVIQLYIYNHIYILHGELTFHSTTWELTLTGNSPPVFGENGFTTGSAERWAPCCVLRPVVMVGWREDDLPWNLHLQYGFKMSIFTRITFVVPLNDVCKNLALGIWLNC